MLLTCLPCMYNTGGLPHDINALAEENAVLKGYKELVKPGWARSFMSQ